MRALINVNNERDTAPQKINLIKCNMCDELLNAESIQEHVKGKSHSIKKRIAEYNEMTAHIARAYPKDTSTIKSWIQNLYSHDYLSRGD